MSDNLEKIPVILSPMKTGSTSLWIAVIKKYNPLHRDYVMYHPLRQHLTYRDKTRQYARADKHDNFVITVRNPYSRLMSLYNYAMRGNSYHYPGYEEYNEDFHCFLKKRALSIDDPMVRYVEGCPEYDIIRYETYVADVKRVFDLDINDYEHCAFGNNGPTTLDKAIASMTPENINYINEIYYDDFVTFGYDMIQV